MRTPYPVLFIERNGDIRGGGHISLINMLRYLDRRYFLPYFVCSSNGTLFNSVRSMGIESEIIETRPVKGLKFFSMFSCILKLSRLVKQWDIRIIHSNAGATRDTFYSALTARFMGVPFIWHVRVIELGGILDRILAILSTRIIAISNAVKTRFSWFKDGNKIKVIYNGVDLDEFRLDIDSSLRKSELKIYKNEIVIGIVGQLIPWKGHKVLFKSVKALKEKVSNIKLLVVGDEVPQGSSYRKKLEIFAKKVGIKDEVIFTGFRNDIPRIMAAIDVFVLPSLGEPFGRVLLEAMAMGKPVVATDSGGVPEIVVNGETGILVPPKDVKAMTEAIYFLITHKKKAQEMGKTGRKRIEEIFTIQQNVQRIQDIYLDILEHEVES